MIKLNDDKLKRQLKMRQGFTMNLGIVALILLAAGLIIGITLAIGRNSNNNEYSSDSSFKLMTIMYTFVAPIILIIAVVLLAFAIM